MEHTKYIIGNTECKNRIEKTDYIIQNTERRTIIDNTEQRMPNRGYRIKNAEYRQSYTENRMDNTE